jgi:predicted DNA-binding transcriptional regulator YafY
MTLSERRLKFLNGIFRSGKSFTKKELEEKVSRHIAPYRNRQEINDNGLDISKRAIDYDIKKLREEFGAPLVCVSRKYYYTNPKFTIEKTEIDSDALQNIKVAAAILKQIPGLELHKDLMEIFENLETYDGQRTEDKTYIQFDTRPSYDGSKYLLTALESCKIGSVISFDYQPFKADKSKRIVLHPYLLKEYNNRWFLIGMTETACKEKKYEISQFGLERIKGKIKNENIEYYYHPNFNPDEYLAKVIGVSIKPGANVEKVLLRFTSDRAKYVETNALHATQRHLKEHETETHKTFIYDLIPNQELQSVILSFGADVEVVEPVSLREAIADKMKRSKDLYF